MLKIFMAVNYEEALNGSWYDLETEDGRNEAQRLDDLGYYAADIDSDWYSVSGEIAINEAIEAAENLDLLLVDDAELFKELVKSGYYDYEEAYKIVNEMKASSFEYEGVSYTKEEALGYHMEDIGVLDFGALSYHRGNAEILKRYFDYEAYGRDLILGGDYTAIETNDGFIFVNNY